MANLDKYDAIDIYRVVAYPLNNDGTFDLTEDLCGGGVQDLYEGIEFEAPTSFEMNFGTPRQVPVLAQGQVQDTFMLPSIDPKTAILRTAYDYQTLQALLTNTKVDTVGASKWVGMDTDQAGNEKLVGLLLSQLQAHDESGNTVWHNYVLNRARIMPNHPGFSDAVNVKEYNMALSRSSKRLFGDTYTLATHGYEEAVGNDGLSEYKFNIGIWMGNGEYTTFNLPSGKPARVTSAAKVWDQTTGATRAGAWDAATDALVFTPTVMPADGTIMVVTYEYD
jgi:hypothetical protein